MKIHCTVVDGPKRNVFASSCLYPAIPKIAVWKLRNALTPVTGVTCAIPHVMTQVGTVPWRFDESQLKTDLKYAKVSALIKCIPVRRIQLQHKPTVFFIVYFLNTGTECHLVFSTPKTCWNSSSERCISRVRYSTPFGPRFCDPGAQLGTLCRRPRRSPQWISQAR